MEFQGQLFLDWLHTGEVEEEGGQGRKEYQGRTGNSVTGKEKAIKIKMLNVEEIIHTTKHGEEKLTIRGAKNLKC